jgi:HK97 family phage prohead protease
MSKEKRVFALQDIELRAVTEGSTDREVTGYGVVYGVEEEMWPGYREKIRAGAFDATLTAGDEVKCFFNHDPDMILSTTRSEPALKIEETEQGLRFTSPIPPTSYGNDLAVNLERKNIRGASFTFSVPDGGDTVFMDQDGVYHREIIKATLYEVGPVTNPAYESTEVSLRSKELFEEMKKKVQKDEADPVSSDVLNLRRKKVSLIERGL